MIKPIETVYNGYRFRSRLEARWAVFFDVLEIEYDYEPEGFDLDGLWYLPDFWLPNLGQGGTWIEIKARTPTMTEIDKIATLGAMLRASAFVFWGKIGPPKIEWAQGRWKRTKGSVCIGVNRAPNSNDLPRIGRVGAWSTHEDGSALDIWPINFETDAFGFLGSEDNPLVGDFCINPLFPRGWLACTYLGPGRFYDSKILRRAYIAARQARFEHGEKGG